MALETNGNEFIIKSLGKCFICLSKAQSRPSPAVSPATSSVLGTGSSSLLPSNLLTSLIPLGTTSIQYLSQFLRLDRKKLFTNEAPIPPDLLRKAMGADLKVELCESCGSITEEFGEMFKELERLKLDVVNCLVKIHRKMMRVEKGIGKGGGSFVDEFQKLIEGTSMNNQEVLIIEELRKEIMSKCLTKLKVIRPFAEFPSSSPRIQQQRKSSAAKSNELSSVTVTAGEVIEIELDMDDPSTISTNSNSPPSSTPTSAVSAPTEKGPQSSSTINSNSAKSHPRQQQNGNAVGENEVIEISDSDDDDNSQYSTAAKEKESLNNPLPPPTNKNNLNKSSVKKTGEEGIELFTCKVCSRQFTSFIKLGEHGVLKHSTKFSDGKLLYYCRLCKETFVNFKNLQKHIGYAHSGGGGSGAASGGNENSNNKNASNTFKCGYCPAQFPTQKQAETHLRERHPPLIIPASSEESQIQSANSNNASISKQITPPPAPVPPPLQSLSSSELFASLSTSPKTIQTGSISLQLLLEGTQNQTEALLPVTGDDDAKVNSQEPQTKEKGKGEEEVTETEIMEIERLGPPNPLGLKKNHRFKCGYCPSTFPKNCMLTAHCKVRHPGLPPCSKKKSKKALIAASSPLTLMPLDDPAELRSWMDSEAAKAERSRKQVLLERIWSKDNPTPVGSTAAPAAATSTVTPPAPPSQQQQPIPPPPQVILQTPPVAAVAVGRDPIAETSDDGGENVEMRMEQEEEEEQNNQPELNLVLSNVISITPQQQQPHKNIMEFFDESELMHEDEEEEVQQFMAEEEMEIGDVKLFSGPSLSLPTFKSLTSVASAGAEHNTSYIGAIPSTSNQDKIKEFIAKGVRRVEVIKLKCDYCSSTFITKSGLLSHVRCRHSNNAKQSGSSGKSKAVKKRVKVKVTKKKEAPIVQPLRVSEAEMIDDKSKDEAPVVIAQEQEKESKEETPDISQLAERGQEVTKEDTQKRQNLQHIDKKETNEINFKIQKESISEAEALKVLSRLVLPPKKEKKAVPLPPVLIPAEVEQLKQKEPSKNGGEEIKDKDKDCRQVKEEEEDGVLMDHTTTEPLSETEQIRCTFCGERFDEISTLQEHFSKVHQQYKCNYCEATFFKKGSADIHMKLHHRREQQLQQQQSNNNNHSQQAK